MKKFELENLEEGQEVKLTSQDEELHIHHNMTDSEAEAILSAYPPSSYYIKEKQQDERS